jgi:hypothetical protein
MQVSFHSLFPDFKLPAFCDVRGDTPVHDLIAANPAFDEFATRMKELRSHPDFFEMLTTTNNYGEMPVLSVKKGQQETGEKIVLLADYFRQIKIKPLAELINLEEVERLYANETSQVKSNLSIAVQVVNLTRACFKESSSHPDINYISNQEQEEIRMRLDNFIKECKNLRGDNFFKNAVELTKKARVGNCENFTWISLDVLMEKFPQVVAQRYSIGGGDHVFIIIDTELKQEAVQTWKSSPMKINDWWSENAVVCDPWTGSVYPAREMPAKLMTREYSYDTNDTRKTNWLGRVNPQIHYLQRKMDPDVDLVVQAFYNSNLK